MTSGRDRSCPVADPESVKCGGGWESVEHAEKLVEITVVQLQVKLTQVKLTCTPKTCKFSEQDDIYR